MRLTMSGVALVTVLACAPDYDVIVRGGTVYDGSGAPGVATDVGIEGDSIVTIGDLSGATARDVIDAAGLAIAPGFINMLSWATESLIEDGRSMGDIRQGVTLEVFGEGWSMGPLSDSMRQQELRDQGDIKFEIPWTTLGEYLDHLVERGISPNVASFVGATTVRIHELGRDDVDPTPEQLERMRALVREAMEEGAVGVGSSLIYAPAFFAETEELIALAGVASEYGGMYISHIRGEGSQLLRSIDELMTIAREASLPAEIYHFKASGRSNWHLLDSAIAKVTAARDEGLEITADMYTYPASSTGLDAAMPLWVQEGGYDAWADRLRDPAIRARVRREMATPTAEWTSGIVSAGGPEGVLLVGFKSDSLKPLAGKTLADVAAMRGRSAEETAMDLVIEDGSRVQVIYFSMSEDNVRKKVAIPWMSFGSDASSMAPEGVFVRSSTHPRAYGTFARLLGRYVRDEGVIPLEEAIRKLTSQPAENLHLRRRGRLTPGYFADIVVFDPATIQDRATFTEPHQLATGVEHVLVNGVQVLRGGEHTGAFPGRVLRGPGWTGWHDDN